MHAVGPDDPLVDAGARLVLDALAGATFPTGTLVLLTADHGMSPVDPARTVYVNELWAELAGTWGRAQTASRSRRLVLPRSLFPRSHPAMSPTCAPTWGTFRGVADVVPVDELVAEGIFAEPSRRLRGAARERRRPSPLRRGGVLARARPLRARVPRPARRLEPGRDGDPTPRMGCLSPVGNSATG